MNAVNKYINTQCPKNCCKWYKQCLKNCWKNVACRAGNGKNKIKYLEFFLVNLLKDVIIKPKRATILLQTKIQRIKCLNVGRYLLTFTRKILVSKPSFYPLTCNSNWVRIVKINDKLKVLQVLFRYN